MKRESFTFYFKSGAITAMAFTESNAQILAQAEAIKRGWDPTIIAKPTLEHIDMLIDVNRLTPEEYQQLNSLLTKANASNY